MRRRDTQSATTNENDITRLLNEAIEALDRAATFAPIDSQVRRQIIGTRQTLELILDEQKAATKEQN